MAMTVQAVELSPVQENTPSDYSLGKLLAPFSIKELNCVGHILSTIKQSTDVQWDETSGNITFKGEITNINILDFLLTLFYGQSDELLAFDS